MGNPFILESWSPSIPIHFIGICGVGMGSVAAELASRGFSVSGSDHRFYPPMSEFLASSSVKIYTSYHASHLPSDGLIVVGNAISRGNEELEASLDRNLEVISLPQLIRSFYLIGKRSIVVAGTHGKSTTTSLIAYLLHRSQFSPGWFVGAIPKNQTLPSPCQKGEGEWFAIEGDEYDTAFFDKRPKFLHYRPYLLLITGIEWDHADIYPDYSILKEAFRRLILLLPRSGRLIANGDDPTVRELAVYSPAPVIFYGTSSYAQWRLSQFNYDGGLWRALIERPNNQTVEFTTHLPGKHNLLNITGALTLLQEGIGVDIENLIPLLNDYQGLKRRLERVEMSNGWIIYNDFAHHPSAVYATLEALKEMYPERKISVIFEPRSNTMVRNLLQKELSQALNLANHVLLGPIYRKELIPPSHRLDRTAVVKELRLSGIDAECSDDWGFILGWIKEKAKEGDVVVLMSNGEQGGIIEQITH